MCITLDYKIRPHFFGLNFDFLVFTFLAAVLHVLYNHKMNIYTYSGESVNSVLCYLIVQFIHQ